MSYRKKITIRRVPSAGILKLKQCQKMPANGFMTARGVIHFSNLKRAILAYIAHMGRFPAHLFKKESLAAPSFGCRGIKSGSSPSNKQDIGLDCREHDEDPSMLSI